MIQSRSSSGRFKKVRPSEKLSHLFLGNGKFPMGFQQIISRHRIPISARTLIQSGHVKWLDCLNDLFEQRFPLFRLQRFHRSRCDVPCSRSKFRVVAEQISAGRLREPPLSFGETRCGKIKKGQSGK